MKKIWAVLFSMMCVVCLSGCMRFSTSVKVKPNGNADVALIYAISDEMADMSDSSMEAPEDAMKEMEDQGWVCNTYTEDGFTGYEFLKYDVALDDLANEFKDSSSDSGLDTDSLTVVKDGSHYILDWDVFDDNEAAQFSSYKNYFDMSGGYMYFELELPYASIDNNATYVSEDGKTLKWDLLNMEPGQNVHVEFSLRNTRLIGLIAIGAIAFFIILLIVIIVVVIVSSKKKKASYQYQGYYTQGGYPPQGFNGAPGMQQGQPYPGQFQQNPQQFQQPMQGQPVPPQFQQPMQGQPVPPQNPQMPPQDNNNNM